MSIATFCLILFRISGEEIETVESLQTNGQTKQTKRPTSDDRLSDSFLALSAHAEQ